MATNHRQRIAIAGIGPYARAVHLPALKDAGIDLVFAAERGPQVEEAKRALDAAGFPRCVVLEAPEFGVPEIPGELARTLDGLIVATDPRSHLPYLEWALRRDVAVLVDKPLTAPPDTSVPVHTRLLHDLERALEAERESGASADLYTSRRGHPGYSELFARVHDTIETTGVPATHVEVSHVNGYWNLPDEFHLRENHPYRYGYGALLHSGYHAVDLVAQVLGLNVAIGAVPVGSQVHVAATAVRAADVLAQYGHQLARLFDDPALSPQSVAGLHGGGAGLGETDVFATVAVVDPEGRVRCSARIDVRETAFCRRAWRDLPRDTYKGNGRTRHERMGVSIGHLATVEAVDSPPPGGAGALQHFTLRTFRNASLIGGSEYEEQVFPSERGRSLCDLGRREVLGRWLSRCETGSSLTEHRLGVRLLAAIYESLSAGGSAVFALPGGSR